MNVIEHAKRVKEVNFLFLRDIGTKIERRVKVLTDGKDDTADSKNKSLPARVAKLGSKKTRSWGKKATDDN